jgi:hypothetical protein
LCFPIGLFILHFCKMFTPPHPILHLTFTNCKIIVFDKKEHRRRAPKGPIFLYH